jgi:hypothetical protein
MYVDPKLRGLDPVCVRSVSKLVISFREMGIGDVLCRVRIDAAQIPLFRNDAKALRVRPDSFSRTANSPQRKHLERSV